MPVIFEQRGLLVTMKPVSHKRTSNVGPSRFNPTIPRNQEKTMEGSKTHITAHKNFCVLLEKTSTHEPSSDTTVGNVAWETKIFLRARRPIMVMSIYERGFLIYIPL